MQLIPREAPYPWRAAVRRTRLHVDAAGIALVRDGRPVVRLPVGPAGVVDAVVVPPETGLPGGGTLVLRDAKYRPIARAELEDWVPEWHDLQLSSRDALTRSGFAEALAAANLPVRVLGSPTDNALAAMSGIDRTPLLRAADERVAAYIGVRLGLLLLGGGLALAVPLGAQAASVVLGAALAGLAVCLFDAAVLARRWLADRRSRHGEVVLRPHAGGRFARRAQVRRDGDIVVLVGGGGAERLLPLAGADSPGSLRSLAVTGSGDRQVELRDAAGLVRAVLPLADWFGTGADAEHRVGELAVRLGLSLAPAGPSTVTGTSRSFARSGWPVLTGPFPPLVEIWYPALVPLALVLIVTVSPKSPAETQRALVLALCAVGAPLVLVPALVRKVRPPRPTGATA